MFVGLRITLSLFLSGINKTWNFLDRFSKNTQIPNFIQIRLLAAELLHADTQKDGQTWRS